MAKLKNTLSLSQWTSQELLDELVLRGEITLPSKIDSLFTKIIKSHGTIGNWKNRYNGTKVPDFKVVETSPRDWDASSMWAILHVPSWDMHVKITGHVDSYGDDETWNNEIVEVKQVTKTITTWE